MSEETAAATETPEPAKKGKKPFNKKKLIPLIAVGVVAVIILVIVLSIVINTSGLHKAAANYASGEWNVTVQTYRTEQLPNGNYRITYLVDSKIEIDTSNGYKKNAASIRYKYNSDNAIGTDIPQREEKITVQGNGENKAKKDPLALRISFMNGNRQAEFFNNMKPFSQNVAYVSGAWNFAARRVIENKTDAFVKEAFLAGNYTQDMKEEVSNFFGSISDCKIEDNALTGTLSGDKTLNAQIAYNAQNDAVAVRGTVTSGSVVTDTTGYILEANDDYMILALSRRSETNETNRQNYVSHMVMYRLAKNK